MSGYQSFKMYHYRSYASVKYFFIKTLSFANRKFQKNQTIETAALKSNRPNSKCLVNFKKNQAIEATFVIIDIISKYKR